MLSVIAMVQNSYLTGIMAEWRARWFLRLRGFRILCSRYVTGRHTGRAEIDIIARRGNLIIFVEVKCRKTMPGALSAISFTQAARLRRAAETYLMQTGHRGDARFDMIVVVGRRIRWIRGAV